MSYEYYFPDCLTSIYTFSCIYLWHLLCMFFALVKIKTLPILVISSIIIIIIWSPKRPDVITILLPRGRTMSLNRGAMGGRGTVPLAG